MDSTKEAKATMASTTPMHNRIRMRNKTTLSNRNNKVATANNSRVDMGDKVAMLMESSHSRVTVLVLSPDSFADS